MIMQPSWHNNEHNDGCNYLMRGLRVLLLGMSLLLSPNAAQASGFGNMFSSMFGMMGSVANMMSTMMSPMGSTGMNGFPMNGMSGFNPMMMGGLPGMGMGMPMNGFGMPFGNSAGTSGYPSYNNAVNTPYQQQSAAGPGNFWLNGLWASESGIYLQITNKVFKLKTPRGSMMGYVTSNGELLNLYAPKSNRTILYTVKLEGNYMQLTGSDGKTHLFRKAR